MSRQRRALPALVGFNKNDLPKELLDGVNITEAASKDALVGSFKSWMNLDLPTIMQKEQCIDVISQSDDAATRRDIERGALYAMIGYAMPYHMPDIAPLSQMANKQFVQSMTNVVAESTNIAYKHYDKILSGETVSIDMPPASLFNGFYIHTPVHVWDKKGRAVKKIPPWHSRIDLLKYHVVGNVNCYVTRRNVTEDVYECNVMFRGTSNEFNGIHQYGEKLKNSPVFNFPKYDPIKNKYYPEGSPTVPLFYEWYATMIDQVKPHIYWALKCLGAHEPGCCRITVTGHSMGGALTQTFCYLSKFDEPGLWEKMFFRGYATPMASNDAAVRCIEQWVIDSARKNKYIDIVNTDDFINLQYMAGGKEGIEESVKAGTHELIAVLMSYYPEVDETGKESGLIGRLAHIAQTYPEMAMTAFLRGAIRVQDRHIGENPEVGHRMGQRYAEREMWGTSELDSKYNGTMRLYKCTRRVDFSTEYFGKSHSNYVGVDTNVFWAMLRSYEDDLYCRYSRIGLGTKENKLRIVPMFNPDDMTHILPATKKYLARQKSYKSPFVKFIKYIQ